MARKRMIDPNIWQSEDFGKLSNLAKVVFIGLFSLADDEGRGRANPMYLKSTLFPYNEKMRSTDVEVALSEISRNMSILFYSYNESNYYSLLSWNTFQKIDKPTESKIPEFEKDNQLLTLTPPIIEVVDGKNLLLDGIHRVVLSCLLEKDNVQCAIVHGAKPLPYAIENPNGWKDVKVFESEVPPGFKTRNRRYPDSEYKYYTRVFNFDGTVQIPRKHHQNDDLSKLLIKNTILQSR